MSVTAKAAGITAVAESRTCVIAVMSTFRPDAEVAANIERVASQAEKVIVIDDTGDGPSSLQGQTSDGVEVITNSINLGLAASLNIAVRSAVAHGATHVLTLDDDTPLAPGYISLILSAMAHARREGHRVLTAGPTTVNGGRDPLYGHVHEFSGGQCSLNVVQSGMLFDVRAFEEVGWFREEFFIDALEPDFLARLHRCGYHTLLAPNVDLVHTVGEPRQIHVGWRTVNPQNHQAFRLYYITRNMLTFVRENQTYEPIITKQTKRWLRKKIFKAILFESRRRAKIVAAWRGYRDFRTGRLGRIEE